ncbi:transposase [Patescibacteria group bacterium]|nr:transposase [Patescibacteria group bacterium]
MDNLPDNTYLTLKNCNRFCGILVVDGKFVKVKGYEKKIPFIYGIDYLTHDIPVGVLAPSESAEAFRRFFRLIKTINYPLRIVVCDDVLFSLKPALNYHYPKAKIQLCHTHYLENIRQKLEVRTSNHHLRFFEDLKRRLFDKNEESKKLSVVLRDFIVGSARKDVVRQTIIMDIWKRRQNLFIYKKIPNCPNDINLIELFNSHLNARLKSIKGFKSFASAERWLNAYLIRRRIKPFTGCEGKFKKLNHKCSLEMTIKKQTSMSEIIQKYQLKMKR